MRRLDDDRPLLLIADRDPFMRQALARALQDRFEVEFVESGEEVLERVKRRRPAAVILEALLPGLDGFQVCQRLKSDPDARVVPVLFFTLLLARERAAQVGADAFLLKPLRRDVLLRTINSLLGDAPAGERGTK